MSILTAQDFVVGNKYTVTTFGLVGDALTFTGTVAGVVSHHIVPATANANINHLNIWPNIPDSIKASIENDYRTYQYLILILGDGTPIYLGLAWIEPTTLNAVINRSCTIVLTEFQDANKARVSDVLRLAGYTVASATIYE